ncbi:hydrogen-translocating pyrophosphatase [Aureococcus anophagefferens]|nr:hydrogen-translocating pyrophosphatase [Aureococcus anophagefferens]
MGSDYADKMGVHEVVFPALVGGAIALMFTMVLYKRLMANPTGAGVGRPLVDKYGAMVKAGAKAFLVEEYKWLFVFVVVLGLILLLLFTIEEQTTKSDGVRTAFAFFLGAALSASAGWLGMMVATDGNTRTTAACAGTEVVDAKTGEVTGTGTLNDGLRVAFTAGAVMGFVVVGLGLLGVGSAFLVVAVNYSKAEALQVLAGFGFGASSIALFARRGGIYTKAADVGADLVGKVEAGIDEDDPHNPAVIADNVGDNVGDVALPFWLAGAGVLASLIGTFAVSTKEKGEGWNSNLGALMWALEKGTFLAGATFLGLAAACCHYLGGLWGSYLCVIIGLATGVVIGKLTEYFTSFDFAPVQSIKARGSTGPATVVIQGLGVGMLSCVPTIFVLVAAILGCAAIKGEYGIAIAAVGMLATLGITLATDAYGPVADNAGGLAEMDPAIPDSVRQITDSLDALGNTTAATGKGFAIGSRCSRGAEIICEVRDQFHNRPDLVAADGKTTLRDCIMMASNGEKIPPEMDVAPDSNKCVEISTRSSVREMVAPGAYAILAPLFVGFLVGPACLVGMLSGAICSGAMVAIMMSNGRRDTSGPALNILIKLMSMVSLTVAPLLKAYHKNWDHYHWGFIPFGLFVIVTYALVKNNILTWQDPIQALLEKGANQADEETGALLPPKELELPEKTGPEQVAVVA